jgi:hypothetical protein
MSTAKILYLLAVEAAGEGGTVRTRIDRMRAAFRKEDIEPNPIGYENRKTGVCTTTRPAGDSCPSHCPLWEECYAKSGPQGIHSRRSTTELQASLASVAMALVAEPERQVRLHASGDFLEVKDGPIQWDYVEGLMDMGRLHLERHPREAAGWTYTQVHSPKLLMLMRAGGWSILCSENRFSPGNTFVADSLEEVKRQNGRACLEQVAKKASCADCLVCTKVGLRIANGRPAPRIGFIKH